MAMNWTPPTSEMDTQARENRVAKLLPIEVTLGNGQRIRVVVRNVSPHGIGARGEVDVVPCERLTVHTPDGRDIPATVRWVRKGTFGLYLDEPINPDMLQVKSAQSTIVPRDAELGFRPLKHTGTTNRSGFQRTHRDQVLSNSSWIQD